MRVSNSLFALIPLGHLAAAQTWPTDLIGTWSTKSNKTLTGPGFYDPVHEQLFEPSLTGISYSFTGDGFYEEAYYRAISNPQDPKCPSGIMQWQHGSWKMLSNGSLVLTPISVDGRQLLSNPCKYSNGIYTRWNVTEVFLRYSVYTDPYHKIPRLDLFKFDGAPVNPMYLAMSPPQMLPTTTLNPISSATAGVKASTTARSKRALDVEIPLSWRIQLEGENADKVVHRINADRLWWLGVGLTGFGGVLYLIPRRTGHGPRQARTIS